MKRFFGQLPASVTSDDETHRDTATFGLQESSEIDPFEDPKYQRKRQKVEDRDPSEILKPNLDDRQVLRETIDSDISGEFKDPRPWVLFGVAKKAEPKIFSRESFQVQESSLQINSTHINSNSLERESSEVHRQAIYEVEDFSDPEPSHPAWPTDEAAHEAEMIRSEGHDEFEAHYIVSSRSEKEEKENEARAKWLDSFQSPFEAPADEKVKDEEREEALEGHESDDSQLINDFLNESLLADEEMVEEVPKESLVKDILKKEPGRPQQLNDVLFQTKNQTHLDSLISRWTRTLVLKPEPVSASRRLSQFLTPQEELFADRNSPFSNQYDFLERTRQMPKLKYMTCSRKAVPQVGFPHQCKRYPRLKNVLQPWTFDYRAEEAKRFKGHPPELMWDPSRMSEDQVIQYLDLAFQYFSRKEDVGSRHLKHSNQGLTEEIALKYLVSKDYNMILALQHIKEHPQEVKEQLMASQNRLDERLETLAYIASLDDEV